MALTRMNCFHRLLSSHKKLDISLLLVLIIPKSRNNYLKWKICIPVLNETISSGVLGLTEHKASKVGVSTKKKFCLLKIK